MRQSLEMFRTASATMGTRANSASIQLGLKWKQVASKTLSSLRVFFSSVSGSPSASWAIYPTDEEGIIADIAIASGTFNPSGAALNTLTVSGGVAVNAGDHYVLVLANTHGTPASNYFDIPENGAPPVDGDFIQVSYNSGTTWNKRIQGVPYLQFVYSDSSRWGPHGLRQVYGAPTDANVYLYDAVGTRRALYGVGFQPQERIRIFAFEVVARLVGTLASAGVLRGYLYSGTTLIATSDQTHSPTSNSGASPSGDQITFTFGYALGTGVLVEPGTDLRLVVGQSAGGGDGSNHFILLGSNFANVPPTGFTDAPHGGFHATYSNGTSISWAVSSTNVPYTRIEFETARAGSYR